MPAAAENLGSARLVLREWLAAVRWPADDIEYVVLAVNEALTNAIEHAYAAATPGLHPSVDVYGVVQPVPDAADSAPSSHEAFTAGTGEAPWRAHIEVIDQGAWRLRNVDLHDQFRRGGRGLPMMEAVMDQVTIDVTPGGGDPRRPDQGHGDQRRRPTLNGVRGRASAHPGPAAPCRPPGR
jgi:anti-sigma regulatory factor (Ser/Thr protein kinase)